jgi:hypothetical protein
MGTYYFEMTWWVRLAAVALIVAIFSWIVIHGIGAKHLDPNDGLNDEPQKRSRVWIWWTVAALLFMGYPLSIGPVFLLARNCGGLPVALMVYMPILGTLHRCPPVGRVVIWYLHLWGAF